MAVGDAAAAAGMDLVVGTENANTLDTEINKTRDMIAEFAAGTQPISEGGTGATNAAAALANLGAVSADEVMVSTNGQSVAGTIPRYDSVGRIVAATPAAPNHAASKAYVDAAINTLRAQLGL